jgi:hypothetical protein
MALNPDGTKTCPRCNQSHPPVGNFYRSGKSPDGYTGYCIPCTKAAAVAWQKSLPEDRRRSKNKADWERRKRDPEQRRRAAEYQKRYAVENPEKMRAWQQAYKDRDPERRRQMNAVHNNHARAKRLGLESNFKWIDWCEVLEAFENRCAFCGTGQVLLDMEHVVPLTKRGANTVGNVVPACRPCNAQKSGRSLEEFARIRGLSEAEISRISTVALCVPTR